MKRAVVSVLILTGLSLLAGAGGCTAATDPIAIPVEQQEWTCNTGAKGRQLLTPHYDLRMTATDTVLQEYLPPFMETALREYRKLMPPPQEAEERLVVYIFNNRPEWADFTRVFAPAQANTYLHIHSGGYMDQARAVTVIWDIGRDNTLALLAHEGMHQYLARHFPEPLPPWLNEGLATQWESFDLRGPTPVFTTRNNYIRRNNLRDALSGEGKEGLIPLTELLRMDAGEAVVKTGAIVRTYYAQVWSLILFLREGVDPGYSAGFKRLLADAGTERLRIAARAYRAATAGIKDMSKGEVIFRHYITEDLDTFTAKYREYIQALLY